MNAISIIKSGNKELYRIIESDGKNSFDLYPAEINCAMYQGKPINAKLAKIEYKASENTIYFIWQEYKGD